jgi:uncharacterized protein
MVIFLVIVLSITFGLHYFVWMRLVRDASLPSPWPRVLTILIATLGVVMSGSFFVIRFGPRELSTPVAWVGYTWMGVLIILFFTLVPMEVVRIAGRAAVVDPERRLALSRILAGAAGLVGLGLSGLGMVSALSRIGVVRVRVALDKLPKALDGYTIVQLSDIHVGPTIGREFIEKLVASSNAEKPDMVVITGDLVDGSVERLAAAVEPLKDLVAKDGVYFITGNHEYYSGADEWIAHLGTLGIRVLRNERLPIRGEGGFDLAGVDDTSSKGFGRGHGQDVPKALAGRDESRLVVLLAHQPKAIFDAARLGVDLQLSGHTHGGQIWPWGYAVKLDQPHVAGLATHAGSKTQIYTSRGTGYWGPPMRVGAPAEVTRIELVATA